MVLRTGTSGSAFVFRYFSGALGKLLPWTTTSARAEGTSHPQCLQIHTWSWAVTSAQTELLPTQLEGWELTAGQGWVKQSQAPLRLG